MTSVSTIIPCYNSEKYLCEAIESVLLQTRSADEILVVDDCSTDSSREIAARYPIILLQTSKNSGHATARNLGIQAAKGDIIAWLDADDYWELDHLETVVGLLDIFPEATVAFSGVRFFGTKEGVWAGFPCDDEPKDIFEFCAKTTVVPAMSAITRKGALIKVGGFDEKIHVAPDFDLWLRMSLDSLFVSTSKITSNYRWHNEQISTSKQFEQAVSVFRSRYQNAAVLHNSQDACRAEFLHHCSRQSLEFTLWRAFWRNDREALLAVLSLAEYVDNGASIAKKYKRRLRFLEQIPFLARILFSLPQVRNKHATGTI